MPTFYAGQQDYIPKLNELWDNGVAAVSAADVSADAAAVSAATASTKANEAAASASAAASSATTAATQATNSAASASSAGSSATNAANSATNAASSASSAASSAASALTNANASAANTNAPLWVSGTTYALGALVYSSTNGRTYRRIVAGAGTTDPSSDTTNWRPLALDVDTGYPTIRPSLNLDFANSQTIDPRITFTRPTGAIRTNSRGLLETVASGTPRIDFDPITLACRGLLVEESRTNLLTYSEDFSNAAWTKSANTTITSNTVVSPDGTADAETFGATAITSGYVQVSNLQTKAASATTYTGSVYIKASSGIFIHVFVDANSTSNSGRLIVNTTDWSVFSTGSAGTFTSTSGAVTHVGNGWYRLTVTTTSGTETSIRLNVYWSTLSNSVTFTPAGTEQVYIWGAQLEAGAFPTSYIATSASQVTRAADVAVVSGANFSSWYRQDEGTFVVTGDAAFTSNNWPYLVAAYNPSLTDTNISLLCRGSVPNGRFEAKVNGVAQASINGASVGSSGVVFTLAGVYKENDFQFAQNGTLGTADTSGTVPSADRISLGSLASTNFLTGHIRSLRYYPARLTNAQLQTLTTP